jgi:predicted PurR-regulated permease PerM
VAAVVVVIVPADLNAALILGLWVLRTIVLYVVVASFITLLLTPATRFLGRRGLSYGGATLLVFLLGAAALTGPVYLFTSPLVTAAEHFAKEIPTSSSRPKRSTACRAAVCSSPSSWARRSGPSRRRARRGSSERPSASPSGARSG